MISKYLCIIKQSDPPIPDPNIIGKSDIWYMGSSIEKKKTIYGFYNSEILILEFKIGVVGVGVIVFGQNYILLYLSFQFIVQELLFEVIQGTVCAVIIEIQGI